MLKKKRRINYNLLLVTALITGIATGWSQIELLTKIADIVSQIVINLLKLVSLPMIFFSVVSTVSGMQSFGEIRTIGKRVLLYTVLTTTIAAFIGLGLFLSIDPVKSAPAVVGKVLEQPSGTYLSFLFDLFPSNALGAFVENRVIGVMVIALILGLATLSLPKEQKNTLNHFFSSFFAAILRLTQWLVHLMPLAVWAFVSLFIDHIYAESADKLSSFFLYILCVLAANLVQGFIVLPLFVKLKGLSPLKLAKGTLSALTLGFFTRSSNAALPVTLQSVQENLKVSKKISNFSIPLCATINMNGCAAFITITVLYVASSAGVVFSGLDYALWALIATVAAIGNAGVAMGCYFLSSALLAAMDVPLTLLGMILPMYTLIDMVETSLNIWSDVCVTAVVDKELGETVEEETTIAIA